MIRSRIAPLLASCALVATATACGPSDSAEPSGESTECAPGPYFDVAPVPLDSIVEVKALGEIHPPGDILPNGQSGFNLEDREVPVVAPGRIVVRAIERTTWLESSFRKGQSDYSLRFNPAGCDPIYGVLAHLTALDPALEALLDDGSCEEGRPSGEVVVTCETNVSVELAAGDPVGRAGGGPTASGLDFDFFDMRSEASFIAQDRYGPALRAICMQPLFEEPLATELTELVGHWGVQRIAEPRCGTLEVDVPGTAQGMWLTEGENEPYRHDTSHLFLVLAPHFTDPDHLQVLGSGAPSLHPEQLHVFERKHAGRVNRDFAELEPDDVVYCYHAATHELSARYPGWDEQSFFVSLGPGERLTVERTVHASGASPCSDDPSAWSFGSGAVHYLR